MSPQLSHEVRVRVGKELEASYYIETVYVFIYMSHE